MKYVIACCVLSACRFHFDEVSAVTGDAAAPMDTVPITVVTFGERETADHRLVTEDTYVHEGSATSNHGGAEDLSVAASEWTLLRFDIDELTPATQVLGARLELVAPVFGDEQPGLLRAYEVTEAWVEGTGPPADDGATWNSRAVGVAWSTESGSPGTEIVSFMPSPPTTLITLPSAVVQAWVDNPAGNHGLVIQPADLESNTHEHFHSSESLMTELRPLLVIELPR